MKLNIFKRAFSLTELLIVLVVVAVLFAAMIPMVTKRNRGQTSADEPVWTFVKDDPQKSAFFDPGSSAITSAAYIGFKPDKSALASLKPHSKVVIRAKEPYQNHIQFRTGNDGNGTLAGIFIATPQNMVLGSRMRGDVSKNYHELIVHGGYNTILGQNAAANLYTAGTGTAVGSSAGMGKAGGGTSSSLGSGVAVGNNSNLYGFAQNSTLIGANTGKTESVSKQIQNTVAVGANNLGLPTSSGQRNVLMGASVGGVGFDSTNAMDNVILNSSYYGTTPKNNTIIGYKTYEGGFVDAQNITTVGYNSCLSFQNGLNSTGSNGTTTCIGYNSAGKYGKANETKNFGWETDRYDHLFIGGKPNGGFPGRSVLEIHNIPYKAPTTGTLSGVLPNSVGPTVVMNSNLVVRGNLYFTDSNDGQVSAFKGWWMIPGKKTKCMEKGYDKCKKNCGIFGRKKWRTADCKILGLDVDKFFLLLFAVAAAVFTAGGALGLTGVVIGAWLTAGGSIVGAAFLGGDNFDRVCDPNTFSGLIYTYSGSSNTHNCSTGYAPYFTKTYCPNVLRTSDVRLKDNISENNDAIAKLLLLEPYNYTYKADKDKTPQVGVMAQDLEKVFKNAVTEDKDGYKAIRWDDILYVVINSVKSLDESTSVYEKELKSVENDVGSIDKDHKQITERIKVINKRITKLESK